MVPRSTGSSLAVSESAFRFPETRVSTCDNCIDVLNSKGAFFGAVESIIGEVRQAPLRISYPTG